MCTLSVIRVERGLRVMFNRDEQRSRGVSEPPMLWPCGERAVLAPVDVAPDGTRGTWIGVNDAGVVVCLLNATALDAHGVRAGSARRSRGQVVLEVLRGGTLREAAAIAEGLCGREFLPFRLAVLHANKACVVRSNGEVLVGSDAEVDAEGLVLTSSGLGDELVQRPRMDAYERCFRAWGDRSAAQRAFHAQRYPEAPHLGVLMTRADARTVSRTAIDLYPTGAVLTHALLDEGGQEIEPGSRMDLAFRCGGAVG